MRLLHLEMTMGFSPGALAPALSLIPFYPHKESRLQAIPINSIGVFTKDTYNRGDRNVHV